MNCLKRKNYNSGSFLEQVKFLRKLKGKTFLINNIYSLDAESSSFFISFSIYLYLYMLNIFLPTRRGETAARDAQTLHTSR